ncbi:sulfotransferase [Schleiferiaceae bacterium]|nr:sulfotransferase [Schleiferiaceae bacterium]
MKLDFVCVGAQKAGTTSLHDTLQLDSRIKLANNKEAHWFEIEERYSLGVDNFFEKFYGIDDFGSKIIGLINPNLILKESALERLKEDFPEVKIIYILRDPLERAWSHYQMTKARGIEKLEFPEALKVENDRIFDSQNWVEPKYKTTEKGFFELNHYSYKLRSDYYEHLNLLQRIFKKENVLICDFNTLKKDSEQFLRKIYAHIGLEYRSLDVKKSNETKGINLRNLTLYKSGFGRLLRHVFTLFLPSKIIHRVRKKIRTNFLTKNEKISVDLDDFKEQFNVLHDQYQSIIESL